MSCQSDVEGNVVDAIFLRIPSGIADGIRNHLNAVYLFGIRRQEAADRADSAVKVPHDLLAGKLRIVSDEAVKTLRLFRIDLIEGERRDMKRHLPVCFLEEGLSAAVFHV